MKGRRNKPNPKPKHSRGFANSTWRKNQKREEQSRRSQDDYEEKKTPPSQLGFCNRCGRQFEGEDEYDVCNECPREPCFTCGNKLNIHEQFNCTACTQKFANRAKRLDELDATGVRARIADTEKEEEEEEEKKETSPATPAPPAAPVHTIERPNLLTNPIGFKEACERPFNTVERHQIQIRMREILVEMQDLTRVTQLLPSWMLREELFREVTTRCLRLPEYLNDLHIAMASMIRDNMEMKEGLIDAEDLYSHMKKKCDVLMKSDAEQKQQIEDLKYQLELEKMITQPLTMQVDQLKKQVNDVEKLHEKMDGLVKKQEETQRVLLQLQEKA